MSARTAPRPFNAHVAEPFMSILNGFAQAQTRMIEREVHRGDERPVGDGWVCIESDDVLRLYVWERSRYVRSAK